MKDYMNTMRGLLEEMFTETVREMHPSWSARRQAREVSRIIDGMSALDVMEMLDSLD